MDNIAVTIIIPVYNAEEYLDYMLESLYNQTFKNFEVIIVNDGSNDNSEKIVVRYINKYSNIKYLKQDNQGQAEARNNTLSAINGKYTLFLDADDYIESDMLEKMYEKAETMCADITICAYRKVFEYCCKNNPKPIFDADENRIYTNVEVLEMMLEERVKGYLCNKMFLSKSIIENNMHFEKGRIVEDLLPVFKQINMSERIVFINEPLYNYRQHLRSTLHNKGVKLMDDYYFAYASVCKYARENTKVNKDKYYMFILNTQITMISNALYLNIKCGKEFYKKYIMEYFSIYEILFEMHILFKHKIKFILFNKFRIVHYYYQFKGIILSLFRGAGKDENKYTTYS